MPSKSEVKPITAVVYGKGESPGELLASVAAAMNKRGKSVAGFVERQAVRPGRSRCDMILEDLLTGESIQISEDRGEGARGCRLHVGELLRAMNSAIDGISSRPDLLVVNKFGKEEHDGRGVRPLIAEALQHEIPVLIAVPERNIERWNEFCGIYSKNIALSTIDHQIFVSQFTS